MERPLVLNAPSILINSLFASPLLYDLYTDMEFVTGTTGMPV